MSEEVVFFTEDLRKRIRKEFGDEATPEFMNMLMLGKAVYEHGYHDFIPKEKVLEWVSGMYDGGQKQRRIRKGEEHGAILINSWDVIGAASYLSLHGKIEGYLQDKE